MELLASYENGDSRALYVRLGQAVSLVLIPAEKANQIVLGDDAIAEPLVQIRRMQDAHSGGFTCGLTMRDGQSTSELRYIGQHRRGQTIETEWTLHGELRVLHRLCLSPKQGTFRTNVRVENTGARMQTLEMLSSFALGMLSPFSNQADDLRIYRLQSFWSAEGRLKTDTVYSLHLEKAWSSSAVRCERFGSIGSMPVRSFFPFAAVEDTRQGVLWGVQLEHPASWQMELAMRDERLSLSGGLADYDFGHWRKNIQPGESFETPWANLAVVAGGLDDLCDRLTSIQRERFLHGVKEEQELPIAFNEFCTTWGNPSLQNVQAIADKIAGMGIRYFVIDCGWYGHEDWSACMGDWIPDQGLFPHGLKEAADSIRKKGMIPGIWFEMESVGVHSRAYHQAEAHLLRRDGVPITVGTRRFWDMSDPWVKQYLYDRVIRLIRDCGFGYLKVDYNNSIGIGCDGSESLGEALRRNMLATQDMFAAIRREIPGIVIENCASGGHRLEPSMMALVSQASFSDAHECVSIPIIAANLHRVICPAQSQIWAVMRSDDSDDRTCYSLVSTLLGRMCLSGEICQASEKQRERICEAIAFYREAAPIIRDGKSFRFGPEVRKYLAPEGWQGVWRVCENRALYVVHSFDGLQPIPIPAGWRVQKSFGSEHLSLSTDGTRVVPERMPYLAGAYLLVRR